MPEHVAPFSANAAGQSHVKRAIPPFATIEGGGFPVRRPFPVPQLSYVDPFLLLDHLGPVEWGPREAIGAPDHPHRGFETVTYLLAGAMEHRDSHGGHFVMRPGDVQWMTAGSGVVHSEMPEKRFYEEGGQLHGVQLWVNLPQAQKMATPRYQEYPATKIPLVTGAGYQVRVICGSFEGQSGPVETTWPVTYRHATLEPGAQLQLPMAADHTQLVYPMVGSVVVGPERYTAAEAHTVELSGGDWLTLATPQEQPQASEVLVLSGAPIGEPVARYGPFVMTKQEELQQAFADYEAGRMGTLAPIVNH